MRGQITDASETTISLSDTLWGNKHRKIETKTCIYVYNFLNYNFMTCATERSPEAKETILNLESNEMRILQRITGKKIMDRIRRDQKNVHVKQYEYLRG